MNHFQLCAGHICNYFGYSFVPLLLQHLWLTAQCGTRINSSPFFTPNPDLIPTGPRLYPDSTPVASRSATTRAPSVTRHIAVRGAHHPASLKVAHPLVPLITFTLPCRLMSPVLRFSLLVLLLWTTAAAQTYDTVWTKYMGGTADDRVRQILVRPDGGAFIFGETASYNGDVKDNHGGTDLWLMSLSRWGDLLWEKCVGGSFDEKFISARWVDDRSLEIWALTQSQDGDVSCVRGEWGPGAPYQSWKFGIDVAGNLLRQACEPEKKWEYTYFADHKTGVYKNQLYFFNEANELAEKKAYRGNIRNILFTADGGCLLIGESNEEPGTQTAATDLWIAKLDAQRTLRWEKWYGGSLGEIGYCAVETHNGFVVAGTALSQDGDVEVFTGNAGAAKTWLLLLSEEGNLLRQVVTSGGGEEEVAGVGVTPEGDVIVGGSYRDGPNGQRMYPDISWDYWIMRLRF